MSEVLASENLSAELATAGFHDELARLQSEIDIARRRLDLTLDAAGATCGWDWDIVKKRLTADPRFAAITGQDPVALAEGVPTGGFFKNIHPDDIKRVRLAVAGILAGAEVFSKEYRLLKDDGGFRWVRAQGKAIFNVEEHPIKFTGILVDITEQRHAQEQLRIAQVAGGIGTFEHVTGFGTLSVSEQFCALFGLHPTKVLPVRTLAALTHPDDPQIIDLTLPNAHQNEENIELRIKRADDGTEHWLARRGEYTDNIGSSARRYIGVIYDITSEKQTQERLRLANNALAESVRKRTRERDRIWQNSRDLLVILGEDALLRDVNPAWSEILGHGPAEVIGKNLADFVCPSDAERAREAMRKVFQQVHTDLELCHVHLDGTPRWISWMTSYEDKLVYAYGRDVTYEKEQSEILRETEAQLRQSQKMEAVGQLTGGIAHDFNNMLTGIISALAILRRRITAGRIDDLDPMIDAATSSAHRAAALIHRLLAFSRRQSLDRKTLDINVLITSMEELLRRTLGEHIALLVRRDPATWQTATDPNQLESAILNLVINARDAMPNGGTLTIDTTNIIITPADVARTENFKPGNYVVVSVSDTGVGMSKETIEKAFEPFFTTKPIGQGTGLGLSMIYGFAQQTGGYVRIQSELGVGTTIKLYLPRSEAESAADEFQAKEAVASPMGDGETILVVEDDAAVRMVMLEVLKELGYRVIEAGDGNAALPIIESNMRIDLLVSDVGLPGLNGRQLAEIALSTRPNLKVLFVTGYAANAALRSEFLAPGMEMMTKPFALDDLATKVREILGAAK